MFLEWQLVGAVHEDSASGTYFVTRYDDVVRLLTDRRLAATPVLGDLPGVPEGMRDRVRAIETGFFARWPVFSDPPRHTVLRRTMLPAFHPSRARAAGDTVRDVLAGMTPAADSAALAAQARHAFAAGIASSLGFDADATKTVLDLGETLMRYIAQMPQDPESLAATEDAVRSLSELALAHVHVGSDPLARSLHSAYADGTLEVADVAAAYAQLLTGAIEPTAAVLAHAVELMRADPAVSAAYLDRPDAVLAELVRTATPFHFASRHTTGTVPVGGVSLPAGARVVLLLAAANHDDRRYREPLAVDPDRTAPPHVAFGRGRHACPGATAATEMVHAALEWLLSDGVLDRADDTRIPWHATVGTRTFDDGTRS
jgi:cytochrome P450